MSEYDRTLELVMQKCDETLEQAVARLIISEVASSLLGMISGTRTKEEMTATVEAWIQAYHNQIWEIATK